MCDNYSAMLRRGKDGVGQVLSFADLFVGRMDQEVDCEASEAFDEAISELVACSNALKAIADPMHIAHHKYVDAFDEMGNKKNRAMREKAIYNVYLVVKGSEVWSEMKEEFDNTKVGMLDHYEDAQAWMRKLEANAEMSLEDMCALFKDMHKFLAKLRPVATDRLQELAGKALHALMDRLRMKAEGSQEAQLVASMRSAKELLENAMECVPQSRATLEEHKLALIVLEQQVRDRAAFNGLEELVKDFATDDWGDEEKRAAAAITINLAADVGCVGSGDGVGEGLLALAARGAQYLATKCPDMANAEAVAEVLECIVDSETFPLDSKQNYDTLVKRIQAWSRLKASFAALMALGGSTEEVCANTTCDTVLRSFLADMQTAGFNNQNVALGLPTALSKDMETMRAGLDDIRRCRLRLLDQELEKVAEIIRPDAKGGGDGKPWTDRVPEGDRNKPEKLLEHCGKILGQMDGSIFAKTLDDLTQLDQQRTAAYEMFGTEVPEAARNAIKELLADCMVTKATALMMHAKEEHTNTPNNGKLRRSLKRYKLVVDNAGFADRLNPIVRQWCEGSCSFL